MRGLMVKEDEAEEGTSFSVLKIEWKVDAIVANDSKVFAAELEQILNEGTKKGFIVSNMITRDNHELVVIQQRRLLGIPATSEAGKEAN